MAKNKNHTNEVSEGTFLERHGASLIVLLLIFAAITLFLKSQQAGRRDQSSLMNDLPPGLQGRISDHLKQGARKNEILRDQIVIENQVTPQLTSEDALNANPQNVHRLRLDQENTASEIARELEEKMRPKNDHLTPDERLSQKQDRDQFIRDYNKKYEKELVKQFLENARDNGVDIRLDDDLNVTGLDTFTVEQPIRIPQSTPEK